MKNLTLYFPLLSVVLFTALPAKAAPDAQVPVPITSSITYSSAHIEVSLFDEIQVVELLKVIAKTCKIGVLISEDVSGTLAYVDIPSKSPEEALQYVARNAGLNVQRASDGTYIISKKAVAAAQNLANCGFTLQIKLDKNEYKSGDNITMTATLSLAKSHYDAPEKVSIEGLSPMGTLQPTIIALKDYSQIPLREFGVRNSYSNPPVTLTLTEPLTKQFALTHDLTQAITQRNAWNINPQLSTSKPYQALEEPLAVGRYLYFVTYFSQASPIYEDGTIWSGHLASNIVEFEVKK